MPKTYLVPASWMKVSVVGPYRIVPCINPRCAIEKVSRDDLFYRLLSRSGSHLSDHGDRAGAMLAAKTLIKEKK